MKQKQIPKPYNSFGIEAKARHWIEINNEEEATEFIFDNADSDHPLLILGGGSNILLTGDFEGVIVKVNIKGREIMDEDEDSVFLRVGAGENWHDLVMYCVEQGWGGIENLSLIPGCVGAAPIQNIGAYGVEIKDVFDSLEAIHLGSGVTHEFFHEDCQFGYRDSIFKREAKGEFLITRVTLQLSKDPVLNTSYGTIEEELARLSHSPTIKDVSDAVIRIRQSKLPDPKEIGNAGSFFKNPVIDQAHFEVIQQEYPDMPFYPAENDQVKIPAAWLIQTCGWKGKRFGDYGVHKDQALVLVNFGGANGKDIYDLSTRIMESVQETFQIELEREVNVI
ncbi:MAG: UDP-N-acetylmuramate dehydrogenase [Bacteroidia bacterium]